ncbi:hypothetical protein BC831DRAFT_208454, partial [Entophlyctis helioformis]
TTLLWGKRQRSWLLTHLILPVYDVIVSLLFIFAYAAVRSRGSLDCPRDSNGRRICDQSAVDTVFNLALVILIVRLIVQSIFAYYVFQYANKARALLRADAEMGYAMYVPAGGYAVPAPMQAQMQPAPITVPQPAMTAASTVSAAAPQPTVTSA